MISRWYEYKDEAISLRQHGNSIRAIEKQLHIPKSTLSGWFKDIKLTNEQIRVLDNKRKLATANGREKAVIWHNAQKEKRILEAKSEANTVLKKINKDKYTFELALSMLYLGEGAKAKRTSMANSNPKIVKFFIKCLFILYGINPENLRYYLHLRNDQDGESEKKYWSKELGIPVENFSFIKDKRTTKSKTYPNYKGVCVVEVGKVAIQRRLSFISEGFCSKILEYKDD